jgi:hypothetical protein
VAAIALSGCEASVDNLTSESAARTMLDAICNADGAKIEALYKSSGRCPTDKILQLANSQGIVGDHVSDYDLAMQTDNRFTWKNRSSGHVVKVTVKAFEERYYFTEISCRKRDGVDRWGLKEPVRQDVFRKAVEAVDKFGMGDRCKKEWKRIEADAGIDDDVLKKILDEGFAAKDWELPSFTNFDATKKGHRMDWIKRRNETRREPIL